MTIYYDGGSARAVDSNARLAWASSTISWGAVLAGVAAALVTQLTLSVLGVGIGLASLTSASTGGADAGSLSLAAAIWWIGSGLLASCAGGYIAGRMCSSAMAAKAGYHGLISWAAATLVMICLLSSAIGGLLGGVFGAMNNVLGGTAHMVGGAMQTASASVPNSVDSLFPDIERQIRASTGGQDPAQLRDTAVNAVRAALIGDKAQQEQAVEQAAQALAQAQGISSDEAKAKVQDYQRKYEQSVADAKAKAAQAAETAARVASRGALVAFFALVLGALAAALAGRFGGARSRNDTSDAWAKR